MNKNIIPKECRSTSRKKFSADIEAWKNFAQRISKNPHVKSFLLERDGNACAWCKGRFITSKVVHHLTYEHCCSYNRTITILSPTSVDSLKKRLVPDCKSCKVENNERFLSCMNKLVLVHSFCNRRIAEKTYAIVNEKVE
jgi:hypothetical protein